MTKKVISTLRALLATAIILMVIAKLSFIWTGSAKSQGQLIVTGRLTKNILKTCRDYTQEEFKKIPIHMRQAQLCEQAAVSYFLNLSLDGKTVSEGTLNPQSSSGDHPTNFQKILSLEQGVYQLKISLVPEPVNEKKLKSYYLKSQIVIESGKRIFVTLDEDAGLLKLDY